MSRIFVVGMFLFLSTVSNQIVFAQLQVAAAAAKTQLDIVVTGNPAAVNAQFITATANVLQQVINELPESRSAPAPASPSDSSMWELQTVSTVRCVPVYGCLGRCRGYRNVTVCEVRRVPKRGFSGSPETIRRAILEELVTIRLTLLNTNAAQTQNVIELSKQAVGLVTLIQRRNLQ